VEIRVLGPLEVVDDGRDVTPPRPKQRALLALLLLRANEVVSTDELIEALWGPAPPETAPNALQGHVSALRKLLGPDAIDTRPPGYALRVEPERTDLGRAEALVEEGHAEPDPARKSELFRAALRLFRGEPLGDFRYEDFARADVERLEDLRLTALEERIDADLALGRHAELVPELERLVADHPLRERLCRELMLALYRSGRQADALDVYREARRRLGDELGLEPGPALKQLERQILAQDPSLELGAEEDRPAGTVTFLFSDVEGSTRLLRELGPAYPKALDEHRTLLRDAFARHRGHEVDTQGDAFFVSFPSAREAVSAALEIQRALAGHTWPEGKDLRVRMGVHTCEAQPTPEGYVGIGVHRAARICAAGHGGQVLVSQTTRELLAEEPLDEVDLKDLGPHRLKDLTQAERLYQLLALGLETEFPPLDTLESRPTNLPVQPTAIVGREDDLAEVRQRLLRDELRLLTLTGAGGSGKTRLALQAAADVLEQFPAGVFFVGLAPIADPEDVVPAIAQALGVKESGGRTIADALEEYLAARKLLLLVDNFEHVVAAAAHVSRLLGAAPDVKLLVTSREPLHVTSEHVYPVPPLPSDEAVSLFVERAQAIRPDFELTETNADAVTEISRRVDGLPLAIELAAARVVLFPPAALLSRLDQRLKLLTGGARDRPERHQTLRAAIDWSYELLAEPRKALFARLSAFAGGWTLEAAEAVCDRDLDVIDGLSSLVDKNLIRLEGTDEEPRFAMLDTIREYALERLDERGEAEELRRRHSEWFVAFVETARSYLRGPEQSTWVPRMHVERDNVRAALDWSIRAPEPTIAARFAIALEAFWNRSGEYSEGSRWLEAVLALDVDDEGLGARVLAAAAKLDANAGRLASAESRYGESVATLRRLGDSAGLAEALRGLGHVHTEKGEYEAARATLREAMDLFEELGDRGAVGGRLISLGIVALLEGDLAAARGLLESAVDVATEAGDHEVAYAALHSLGDLALVEGKLDEAVACYASTLRWADGHGDDAVVAHCLAGFAAVHAWLGEVRRAGRFWSAARELMETLGGRFDPDARDRYEEVFASLDGSARTAFDEAAAERVSREEAVPAALETAELSPASGS
jgi:predicted ATPase/DNA-binding SARP family transcriptional activator